MASWERIGQMTSRRRADDLYYACLYDDSEFAAMLQGAGATGEYTPQTMTSNIVRRQVDTYTAKISKNRPVPMGLTTGGNYSQQRRAKALSKFYEGVLDEVDFWETRTLRLRDQAVWGDGFALNWRNGRKLVHDRVYPWEIRVDPRDAYYGKPKTLFLGRYVDRLVAKEQWPGFDDEIDKSTGKSPEDMTDPGWDETSDQVLVVWAWHLRSGESATDGAFVTCVSDATLCNTSYERDYFPISKNAFSPPQMGWRGEGMVKQIAGLQYEVNAIGLLLQERHYLTGSYVLVEDGSGVEMDLLDNGTLTEVRWRNAKPEFIAPPAAGPDLLNYYMSLRGQFAAEETRISQLSSHGEIPAGMRSGKAQRVYHDIESEGFVPQGRSDEKDVIDTCWQFFDLAEEIYGESIDTKSKKDKDKKPYTVRVETREHGKSILSELSYKDVRLDKEQFTLRVFPTSFLSSTPAERYEDVKDMVDAGFLSQDEALTLLDFPDTSRVLNLRGAARRNVERIVQQLLEADDPNANFVHPEPQMNLELCMALGIEMYLEAKLDGAPEKNLLAVIDFIEEARAMKNGEVGKPVDNDPNAGAPDDPSMQPPPGPGGPMPGGPGMQYAPPDAPPMPANAIAPSAMAPLPPGAG